MLAHDSAVNICIILMFIFVIFLVTTLIFFCYQVTQTKAAIGEREGKIDNKIKIEIIKEEVRKIDEEHQEQKEEETKEIERVSMILY
jgi:predicted Holliday junction resolvase-like endonuclease